MSTGVFIMNECYFCDSVETTYCKTCGHWFCKDCKHKYKKRIHAMLREKLGLGN